MQPEPNYDFILSADHKPKKSLLPNPNSKLTRILIVLGGVVVLLVIVMVLMAVFSSAGSAGKAALVKAAQQQAEIIRVSQLGEERAQGVSAKNLATTTRLSIQSDQTALVAALKNRGTKISPAELALGKNAKTDTLLTTAEQSNKFDEVFIQTLQEQLLAYQKSLEEAYDATESEKLQETLSAQYTHAGLLANAEQ